MHRSWTLGKSVLYSLLATVGIGSPGCNSPATDARQEEESQASPSRQPEISYLDYDEFTQALEQCKGKVVVIDVWSTSCLPCIEALPRLAELSSKYSVEQLACLTLNLDYTGAAGTSPQESETAVNEILEATEVSCRTIISRTPDRELFKKPLFEENGIATVPAILVLGRDGQVVTVARDSPGDVSPYDEVEETVAGLLAGAG